MSVMTATSSLKARLRLGCLSVVLFSACSETGEPQPATLPLIGGSWIDTQATTLGCAGTATEIVTLVLEQSNAGVSGDLRIPSIALEAMPFSGAVTLSDELSGVAELIRAEGGDIRFDVALKVERDANKLVGRIGSQVDFSCEDDSVQSFTATVELIEQAGGP